MRYTRYDYNKSRKFNKGILQMIMVFIMAVVIGVVLFKFFSSEIEGTILVNNNINENQKIDKSSLMIKSFQCGVYSTEDSAKIAREAIPQSINSMIIHEDNYYKIIVGFYEENSDIEKKLQENKIDNYEIEYELPMKKETDKKRNEVVKAYMKIIEKISQDNVEDIDSTELKKWIKDNCNGYEDEVDIVKLEKFTDELPDKIKKDNIPQIMTNIYNCLQKFKKN